MLRFNRTIVLDLKQHAVQITLENIGIRAFTQSFMKLWIGIPKPVRTPPEVDIMDRLFKIGISFRRTVKYPLAYKNRSPPEIPDQINNILIFCHNEITLRNYTP